MKQQLLFSLMALLPMLASAQDDDVTIDGIFYYLDDYTPYGGDIYATVHRADDNLAGTVFILNSITGTSGKVYPVTKIDEDAFKQCSQINEVVIPDNVRSIGEYAFGECTALKNVYIGKGLTFIDEDAFEDCNALSDMTVTAATPPSVDDKYVIDPKIRAQVALHVSAEAIDSYKADEFWSSFKSIDDVVNIPTATAIDKVVNRSSANRQSYDLQGRQLALPQKGIIICNGKKYLKK